MKVVPFTTADARRDILNLLSAHEGRGYGWGDEGNELPVRPDVAAMIRDMFQANIYRLSYIGRIIDGLPKFAFGSYNSSLNSDGTVEHVFGSADKSRQLHLGYKCRWTIAYLQVGTPEDDDEEVGEGILRLSPSNPDDFVAFTELFTWLTGE